jgi:ankyrin repeat protein
MGAENEIIEAIQSGDLERVRGLIAGDPSLAASRNETGVSAVLLARYHFRLDMVELLRGALEEVDLFEASALGDRERVAELLGRNPEAARSVSADGGTALHFACFFGHPESARLLVEAGAPLDAVAPAFGAVQPLHSAAAGGKVEIVRLLLEHGADPNATQAGGTTPLHTAARHGSRDMVEALLAHDASPGAENDEGATPAEMARAEGHAEIASLLGG